jgi:hypothetical protein
MRYLLMISADEDTAEENFATRKDLPDFTEWLADLERRGVLEMHGGLELSPTATTVRVRGDEVLLTDGPFAEGREQVGGFAMVNCADLDEAIGIAAGHPASYFGQVEIRPMRGVDRPADRR